ncbi:MAG TPA: rod shape-determining protein RodA [Limnochordales bacterium]
MPAAPATVETMGHRALQGPIRRLVASGDWLLAGLAVALSLLGLVIVYSATRSWVVGDPAYYVRRQAVSLAIGLVGLMGGILYGYRQVLRMAYGLYGLSVLLLVAVLLVGRRVAGTQGWLVFGPLSLQPAELAKVTLIVALARYLGDRRPPESWRDLLGPLAMTAGVAGLVLLQPDLGTAVVFGIILLGMLYVAQVPSRMLATMTGLAVAAVALAVMASWYGWVAVLKPHQIQRLAVFLDLEGNRQGAGWNVTQSLIAIGSGRLFGQGLFQGPQTQLAFVPARHTDFIFATLGEELGFFGAAATLAAYGLLLRRCMAVAGGARDRAGALLASGVAVTIGFHVVFNIGMTLGLAPVMGIPLSLLSYGGSHLIAMLTAVGLAAGVGARRLGW